ncbi:MAG: Lrp/AsnC ligand binding domain-containing protein [archaeon]
MIFHPTEYALNICPIFLHPYLYMSTKHHSAETGTESAIVIAYSMVKVEPGRESGVAQEILKIDGVREASWTSGFCDIMFRAEAGSVKELGRTVLKRVRKTPGVVRTETVVVSPIPICARRPSERTITGRRGVESSMRMRAPEVAR